MSVAALSLALVSFLGAITTVSALPAAESDSRPGVSAEATKNAMAMPGVSFSGPLPPLSASQRALSSRLRQRLTVVAGNIGERNFQKKGSLKRAADYIFNSFEELKLKGQKVVRQSFSYEGRSFENIILELKGDTAGGAEQIVVIGAHYDSVEKCPGADDNGSGLVALLELARIVGQKPHHKTLRFVAFTNEEYYFRSQGMGSYQYARACAAAKEKIEAMIALETIGYYSDAPVSQMYPEAMAAHYPKTGNFLAFVGTDANASLVKRVLGNFRVHCRFPSEGVAAPAEMPGVDWSDHWAFGKFGYAAIMVTDTAPYRNMCYHEPCDTLDKIDFDKLARVTEGLAYPVEELAGK